MVAEALRRRSPDGSDWLASEGRHDKDRLGTTIVKGNDDVPEMIARHCKCEKETCLHPAGGLESANSENRPIS